jgi:hypothetical protein
LAVMEMPLPLPQMAIPLSYSPASHVETVSVCRHFSPFFVYTLNE